MLATFAETELQAKVSLWLRCVCVSLKNGELSVCARSFQCLSGSPCHTACFCYPLWSTHSVSHCNKQPEAAYKSPKTEILLDVSAYKTSKERFFSSQARHLGEVVWHLEAFQPKSKPTDLLTYDPRQGSLLLPFGSQDTCSSFALPNLPRCVVKRLLPQEPRHVPVCCDAVRLKTGSWTAKIYKSDRLQ